MSWYPRRIDGVWLLTLMLLGAACAFPGRAEPDAAPGPDNRVDAGLAIEALQRAEAETAEPEEADAPADEAPADVDAKATTEEADDEPEDAEEESEDEDTSKE